MSWLDIIFILILIGCIAYSIYRGLVKEVFSLASIAIGYIAAINYYLPLSAYTAKVLNPSISKWVSFIGIFIVIFIAVILIGKLIQKVLNVSVTLTVVDRAAGGNRHGKGDYNTLNRYSLFICYSLYARLYTKIIYSQTYSDFKQETYRCISYRICKGFKKQCKYRQIYFFLK